MTTTAVESARSTRVDADVLRDVLGELAWDTRVREGAVGVHVRDGVVTLTGAVENYGQKIAAARAAHRVRGVLDVADELAVRPASEDVIPDSELAQAVRRALEWDALVDDQRITSTVSNGFVTLEGEVDTLSQREDAHRTVRRLKGVRGLADTIRITAVRADSGKVR